MNKDLYVKFKKALAKYDFGKDRTSFSDLYKHSRKYFGHYISSRQFVADVKAMGVSSQVVRLEHGVERRLVFDPKADKYLLNLFPVLDVCPECGGKGVVEIDMSTGK